MPPTSLLTVLRGLRQSGPDPASDRELLHHYAQHRDETAFAEIVRRHGALVMAVCRRLLGHHQDAEDAFQATFLVLARKAGSTRWHDSVDRWLYQTAYHMAKKAQDMARRRKSRERELNEDVKSVPAVENGVRELSAMLDKGLQVLSAPYQEALVVCYLEGRTREDAARHLRLSLRTLERRLTKGKKLLGGWLSRRGITLSATLLAAALAKEASAAPISSQTAAATVRAVGAFIAGGPVASESVSAKALALARAGLKRFAVAKTTAVLLGLAGLCAGSWLARGRPLAGTGAVDQPPALAAAAREAAQAKKSQPRTDLFGEPLPAEAISRLGSLQMRHGEFTNFVRYTPDGKALISHGGDGVRVWDPTSGKLIRSFPRETTGRGYRASLSADGKLLATPSPSGIRLWDVATGRMIRLLSREDCFVARLSPDGRKLAMMPMKDSKTVKVLASATGKELWSFASHTHSWMFFEFSPNSMVLAVAGWGELISPPNPDNGIRFLDAESGREVRRINLGSQPPRAIAFSTDSTLVAAILHCDQADALHTDARVWSASSGKEIVHFSPSVEAGRQCFLSALTFTPDSKSLVTAGSQDGLVVWDIATGKDRTHLGSRFTNSYDLTFAPDGENIAVAARTTIRTIAWPSGRDLMPATVPLDNQYWTAITPDQRRIVTAGPGPIFVSYDPVTGRELHRSEEGKERGSLGVTEDGVLAWPIPYRGKIIAIWDVGTGKRLAECNLSWIKDDLGMCFLTPNHGTIAVASLLGDTIYLVNWKLGTIQRSFHQAGQKIWSAQFSADGRRLFVFCQDHTVHVWDAVEGNEMHHFGPIGDTRPLACGEPPRCYWTTLSPHGGTFAYRAPKGLLRTDGNVLVLFDTATGKVLHELIDNTTDEPSAVCYSRDSRTLAWADENQYVIHLVEVASGKERRTLRGHRGPIRSLTFSADGSLLVSASADTTALVWDLTGRLNRPHR